MRCEANGNENKMNFIPSLSMFYPLLFLTIIGLCGCGLGSGSSSSVNKAPESIVVLPENNRMAIGKTQQFKLVSSYSGDVSSSTTWSSSSSSVATISPDGIVSAVASGETTISATKGGNTYSTSLIVPVNPPLFGNMSGAHASPVGTWDGTYTIYEAMDTREIGTYTYKLNLDQNGVNVTGTSSLRYNIVGQKADGTFTEGNINDGVINFVFKYIDPRSLYEIVNIGSAVITGNTMTGEVLENHKNGWNCSYRFTVNKQ